MSASREGDETAILEVRASNTAALRLYFKLGFQQVGRRASYYSDGEDAVLMERELVNIHT